MKTHTRKRKSQENTKNKHVLASLESSEALADAAGSGSACCCCKRWDWLIGGGVSCFLRIICMPGCCDDVCVRRFARQNRIRQTHLAQPALHRSLVLLLLLLLYFVLLRRCFRALKTVREHEQQHNNDNHNTACTCWEKQKTANHCTECGNSVG